LHQQRFRSETCACLFDELMPCHLFVPGEKVGMRLCGLTMCWGNVTAAVAPSYYINIMQ
jgi:hypothetical protein